MDQHVLTARAHRAATLGSGSAEGEPQAALLPLVGQCARVARLHRVPTLGSGSAVRGHVSTRFQIYPDSEAPTELTRYRLGRPKGAAAAKSSDHPCLLALKTVRPGWSHTLEAPSPQRHNFTDTFTIANNKWSQMSRERERAEDQQPLRSWSRSAAGVLVLAVLLVGAESLVSGRRNGRREPIVWDGQLGRH